MDSQIQHRGACLCGAVRVTARTRDNHIGVCHCSMCRNWGGGPLFAVECGDEIEFEGVEHITTFESSQWAERGFCSLCGSHLFYRLKEGGFHAVPVGLFEGNDWRFTEQIFVDQKPSFYSFANATNELTGEEVFAQHTE